MSEFFNLEKYLSKGSLTGLMAAVIILFSAYYGFFKYFNIQINNIFILLAWVYLFLNIGVARIVEYANEKNLPKCPKCKQVLEIDSYRCKKCGKLHFKNKK
jgi:hypothetical protein